MSDNADIGRYAGQGAMVLMLPAEATRQITGWRVRYDPYYLTIPPHISIMYPPFVGLAEWSAARPALARRLAELPAFDITLARTGAFLAPRHVLWLDPEADGMIQRLEATVRDAFGLPPSPPPFEFTPHVSIGFFDDEPALRQAEAKVLTTLEPITFRARRVTYLVGGDDGIWQIRDELRFSGTTGRPDEVAP